MPFRNPIKVYNINLNMNWSKELWFALLFLTVGFTIWPLLVYYLGLFIQIEFFLKTSLREWAEEIVYGPLGVLNITTVLSMLFLCFPYLLFNLIRLIISQGSGNYSKS